MKMLYTHRLHLTVDGFNTLAIQAQVEFIRPRVRGHVAATNSDKANTSRRQDRLGIRVADVGFVAEDSSTLSQHDGQFMNGRQILLGGRQQVKTDWDTFRGANQVQTPAEKLFALGGTIATKGFAAYFLAARGPRSFAHRQGHTVNDKGFPSGIDFRYQVDDPNQPFPQRVQASVKPRHAQPTHIAQANHQAQGPFMVVLKILGRYHPHRQYLRCAANSASIVRKSIGFQHIIYHNICRYNIPVVHVVPSSYGCLATPILTKAA